MISKMSFSVHQIKERLLRVFDEDGSVRNSSDALEIVMLLENTKITKTELEETRLGKYINDVRRAAKDPSLQKRAKKLIKTWQQMIANTMQAPRTQLPSTTAKSFPSKKQQPPPSGDKNIKNWSPPKNSKSNGNFVNVPNNAKRKLDVRNMTTSKSEPKLKQHSSQRTTTPKSKNNFTEKSSNQSSLTCMTNGLKLTFTTLPSSTPAKESVSSTIPDDKVKLKRKKKDNESSPSKPAYSNKTTKSTSPKSSLQSTSARVIEPDYGLNATLLNYKKTLKSGDSVPLKTNLTLSDNTSRVLGRPSSDPSQTKANVQQLQKVSKPTSPNYALPSDSLYGTSILPPGAPSQKVGQVGGVDGNWLNNGKFYSWSECLAIRHLKFEALPQESPPDDTLVVLPYVEME